MRAIVILLLSAGTAAASPCPRGAALLRVARAAFPDEVRAHGDGTVEPLDRAHLACRGGLLTLAIDDGFLVALVDGQKVIWEEGEVTDDSLRTVIESATLADLDGDGTRELLLQKRHDGHEMSGDTTLEILDDTGAYLAELALGFRNGTMPLDDGGSNCESTWSLVRGPHHTRRIVTLGGCDGSTPDGFALGRHVHAFEDGKLVEIR